LHRLQGKRRKEEGFRTIDEKNLDELIKKFRLLIISLLVILSDQLSKTAVVHYFQIGESTPVLGNFFKLTYILNPGGVFGSKLGSQNFYTIISVLALIVTSWFFFKTKSTETWFRIGLCMVLGGAVGNLIDRLRFGEVVDFLDFDFFNINLPSSKILFFKFPGFYLDRWPVFNLADSFVLIGIVFIIFHLLKSKEKNSPQEDKMTSTISLDKDRF
jgi:signal peptidase II